MKKVAKGGPITINSFLTESDRNEARNHMLKTASVNMREAAKIGLQSLYADPKEVLEKYKDFDIVKEMQARKGAKLLWVRARAIDADTVNANGDYFSKEELLKDVEIKGEKIPAYKTFEGVPIYTNHKNDDIEQAKGMVVYAEWDEKENCVYCTFFVDEEAYPDIARNIRTGVIHDVSMGCSVDYGICSKCKNKAYTEKDYCECLKKYKGKTEPTSGKKIYEENYNLKFIELSCVGDGAFETCEIQEIYDVDDVITAAEDLEKKANEISANIVLAHEGAPINIVDRTAYESCLRVAEKTSFTAVKLAQSAGTLVGGQLLAGPGANQNSTVAAILQALGIDPRSGLNILDMINLSLNFLEVAVMNLFARKDNIDLAYVEKITKAMSGLQIVMQDMIDGGIDVGSGQRPQPINQAQPAAGTAPGAAPGAQQSAPAVGLANYTPLGSVGKAMGFSPEESSVGGGVALASSNVNLVWASKDGKREVFASKTKTTIPNKIVNFTESVLNLKTTLESDRSVQTYLDTAVRLANGRNKNIKNNTPIKAEGRKQMDHFEKIASEQRKKLAAAVTIDFKVEDALGNRLVLSTDGSITGFTKGKQTNWEPILSETQLNMMESGQGTRVAAELLSQYSNFVKTALLDVKNRDGNRQEILEEVRTGEGYDGKSKYDALSAQHKPAGDKTRGEEVAVKHLGTDEEVKEKLLSEAGLYGHKVKDSEVTKALHELVAEVNKGVPTEFLEKQLASCRVEGKASAHEVMSATINALAKAVVSAKETPNTIMRVAQMLSQEENLPEMIGTAAAAAPLEEGKREKEEFFGDAPQEENSVSALLKQLGAAVSEGEISAMDIATALSVAVEENAITKEGVKTIAEALMKNTAVPEEGLDVESTPSKIEELKSALMSAIDADANIISKEDLKSVVSAEAMAAEETGATPGEVIDSVDQMSEKQLIAAIDRAKTVTATDARLRSRARREFWNVKTASSTNITENVIGWLADYSTNFNISTKKIAMAAKRLANDFDTAERLVAKAIEVKQNMERNAGMSVTQHKTECLTFCCTCEDLGAKPSDEGFDEAFKQKAISVLQEHGFSIDPGTFAFTNLNVSSHGDVTATISTSSQKSFEVGEESEGMGSATVEIVDSEVPVIMTDAARIARKIRREELLTRYAQAVPGMAPQAPAAPPAGPVDPNMGLGATGGGEGVLGLTGTDAGNEMSDEDPMASPGVEPGEKKPWGSICPVCGSDDVNISELNADCQSCGSVYEILYGINLKSMGEKGKSNEEGELPELGLSEDLGLGAATAPADVAAAPAAPGTEQMPGMAPTANNKAMFRIATSIDSDVYLRTAMPDFDKNKEKRLPLGMICPSCGSREAHKVKNNTFCYGCGNYAKTVIKANKNNPSLIDATITWID
jgi:hypothetical protein